MTTNFLQKQKTMYSLPDNKWTWDQTEDKRPPPPPSRSPRLRNKRQNIAISC